MAINSQIGSTDASLTAASGLPCYDGTTSKKEKPLTATGAAPSRGPAGPAGPPGPARTECIIVACTDEDTPIETSLSVLTFRMPYAFTLTKIKASLTTAQSSGEPVTVDIKVNGTSILSTLLRIDIGQKTSKTATVQPIIAQKTLPDDSEVVISVNVGASTSTATGLKVYLIG